MTSGIVVLGSSLEEGNKLCELLDERQLQASSVEAFSNLEKHIQEKDCHVAIMDLDNLPLDATLFRKLKRLKPSLNIIGFSSRSFHPELKEAMSNHIYACLNKPLDDDELVYCIKSLL